MADPISQFLNKKKAVVEKYKCVLTDMYEDFEHYGYARTMLMSMLDFIEEKGYITESQIQAIENIKRKPSKYHGR